MSHWYDSVKPGDVVRVDPLWNDEMAKDRYMKLPPVSEVLMVEPSMRARKTCVLLSVRSLTGWTMQLDAGWFRPHETEAG